MNDVAQVLLGAALVAVGVLAAALADRIRGLRVTPEEIRDHGDTARAAPASRGTTTTSAHEAMKRDVLTALVTAGYNKRVAREAVNACAASQCATTESWTRAALRHCLHVESQS